MKKPLVSLFAISLLLTGCMQTVTYDVEFHAISKDREGQLLLASLRVIERRLESLGSDQLLSQDISTQSDNVSITLSIRDKAAAVLLTEELTKPFTLDVMIETNEDEEPDVDIDGHGTFRKTDITAEHLLWIEAQEDVGTGQQSKGRIFLFFTEEGRERMIALFKGNKGKSIGLFVKGRLVSKLRIDTETISDNIVIENIPSYEIAKIFADDVNVGLHMIFTQQ
ncbi:hypothetical protein COU77_00440 [Candidatus Peregrinibacteria bacterium CG10_big_fil_rev_8_21_14_0_10_49_16]|nr:MAG: hypothetical protein COW95_00455 [Candidatus Peregrinibacteria bacterium CG22_combo_CG10-13_8_21_14_all_49_11]PIR52413.1 MAG: hypothetical protein COU77_00440 [Candidatus Peregrinibacteria bacterium CG10_big_fil_rev_8_21_14_0_10_49_16]